MAHIFKRKSVWYVDYVVGGRRVQRSLKTKVKAQAEEDLRVIAKAEAAERRAAPRPRASALVRAGSGELDLAGLEELYVGWAASHRRPKTLDSRVRALRRFGAFTGVTVVARIRREDVETFKRRYLEEVNHKGGNISARAVNEALAALKSVVGRAVREGWYSGPNPFAGVESLPETRRLPRWLSREEAEALLWAAAVRGREVHLYCALGLYAGFRRAECLNARLEWFDVQAGVIHIQAHSEWSIKDKAERSLPLHERLRWLLPHYHGERRTGWVIAAGKEYGQAELRFDLRKQWNRVVRAAGLSGASHHTLRHTFASRLAQEGVDLYRIARWMGHSSTWVTERYAHLAPQDERINLI